MPPPEMLKAYSALIPNAPERFMVLLENQAGHRHDMERIGLNSTIRLSFQGLWV